MPIVGGLDIHRKQITFDYLDTVTGQVCRGYGLLPAMTRSSSRSSLYKTRGDSTPPPEPAPPPETRSSP
jgi:hypothetical protein